MKPKLVTTSEAAAIVGVHRTTLFYWERMKWLTPTDSVQRRDGRKGRPAKLYRQTDVEKVARERGRTIK